MAERIKLTVIDVKEPRPVGQAEVLEFIASGSPDKRTHVYGVWHTALYEHIKKCAVNVDVETKVSEKTDPGGGHYVNRKIVQLYVNGQPVIKKQAGGRFYGKSPEESRAERASNAAQVAVKVITDLEVAGRTVKPELITLRDNWLRKALRGE